MNMIEFLLKNSTAQIDPTIPGEFKQASTFRNYQTAVRRLPGYSTEQDKKCSKKKKGKKA